MLSDHELRRFLSGDDDCFIAVHRAITPLFRNCIHQSGVAPDDVDDVLQETWLRILDKRLEFRDRGAAQGWLWRVCHAICVDWLRSEHRRVVHAKAISVQPDFSCADLSDVVRTRRATAVQDVDDWVDVQIHSLPERQRIVAILRFYFRHPITEIADTLHIAPGTVKAELFRTRAKIRRLAVDQHVLGRYDTDD